MWIFYENPDLTFDDVKPPYSLPKLQYNSAAAMDRFADIAKALGCTGATDKQLTNALVQAIKALNAALGIPPSYQAAGSFFRQAHSTPLDKFSPHDTIGYRVRA